MACLDDLRRVAGGLDAGDGESERHGGNHPVINSILRPFADVSADRARIGAGVADRDLDHSPGRDDYRRYLDRGEDLPRRHADVRQTAHTAGTGQVVEVQLKREWGVGSGEWGIVSSIFSPLPTRRCPLPPPPPPPTTAPLPIPHCPFPLGIVIISDIVRRSN